MIAAVLFVSLIFLEGIFIQRVAQFYVSTRLEHDSETLLMALQPSTKPQDEQYFQLTTKQIHPIYQRPLSGHYYKVFVNDQVFRSRSLWDESFDVKSEQSSYPTLFTIKGPQQESLLVLVSRFELEGQNVIIVVGETLAQLEPMKRQAQLWSALAVGILVFIFTILQYRWTIFTLSPLQALQQQLKELQLGKRQQLELSRSFSELEPLITELNQLIVALDDRIKRSRHAIGNLAHSLKTPMATFQQLCESTAVYDPELADKLQQQLKLINERVDNELKRARIAGTQGTRGQLRVRDEIVDLLATLKNIYREKEIKAQVNIPPDCSYACDRQDFLELCGNLLDNAFKWAEKSINITVEIDENFKLLIDDDGPGCDKEQISALTLRGNRLDEEKPGHGLGLSIVQEIVSHYQGRLDMSTSSLGGLCVEVTLP